MKKIFWGIHKDFRTIIKKILGIILIVTGIVGLFLPFIQGIILIAIGVMLLKNKWIDRKLTLLKKYLSKNMNKR